MDEEKLNKLITDVEVIKTKLDSLVSSQVDRINDHETRIRSLENFKAKFIGAIVLGNVLASTIVGFVLSLFLKGN